MKWSISCTALSAPFKTSFSEPDQAFGHPRWGLIHTLSGIPIAGRPVSHPTLARFHLQRITTAHTNM
jgi:hypothetical protein